VVVFQATVIQHRLLAARCLVLRHPEASGDSFEPESVHSFHLVSLLTSSRRGDSFTRLASESRPARVNRCASRASATEMLHDRHKADGGATESFRVVESVRRLCY
jgi:hypothetical protein